MTVETSYWPTSRFGNNLFQYVVARLFANRHRLCMVTSFTPVNGRDIVRVTPSELGQKIESPIIRITDDPWICSKRPGTRYMLLSPELDLFDDSWAPARYIFEGWFEQSRWYHERRTEIEDFVLAEPIHRVNRQDIVINLRIGADFKSMNWTIHPQWYLDVLSLETFDTLHIVTDVRDEQYLSHFSRFSPIIVSSGAKSDWEYIRSFDRIISSNSSFCWWACFFSRATRIYTFKRWHAHPVGDLTRFPNSIPLEGPFLHEGAS